MTTTLVLALLLFGQATRPEIRVSDPDPGETQAATSLLKTYGYAINETDLIAALQNQKAPEIRTFVVDMLLTLPSTPRITAALKQSWLMRC